MDISSRRLLVPILSLVLALAACGEAPLGLEDVDGGESCRVPMEPISALTSPAVSAISLRPALWHAAGPLSAALPQAPPLASLRQSLAAMAETFGGSWAIDCRALTEAWASLHSLPATAETMPDRDAIALILEMAAGSLAAAQQ